MIKILILSAILFCSTNVRACSKDRPDLCKHLGVSFGLSLMINAAGDAAGEKKRKTIITSIIAVGALGLAKELTDEKIDPSDVAFNTMGSVLGAALYWTF